MEEKTCATILKRYFREDHPHLVPQSHQYGPHHYHQDNHEFDRTDNYYRHVLTGANRNHENVLSDATEALVQVMMRAYCLFLMFIIAHYQYQYQISADNCALLTGKVTHQ